ncbi:hypothetical protein [Lignipirellula cremea]|uniref:Uncharacterized protein n=1 Tax=Lignipirellula cremea TaxID=2528010 RepID=A0A518DQ33_9BACT|nr:hypothetical protein [Lignipirellula cremea]QDU93937.1 hypothetical protein Pla8534_17230 [Lignipirellula cremea]
MMLSLLRVVFPAALLLAATTGYGADRVRFSTGGEDAKIIADEAGVVVEVKSPGGIGHGELHRVGKDWPGRVAFLFDVRGMEGFHVKSGNLRSGTFLGSREPEVYRIKADGTQERVVKDGNLYTPTVKRLDTSSIEVVLPAKLLEGESQIKVHWVDFYRE